MAAIIFYRLSFAQEYREIPPLTKDDRVLILSPHPDDEAIGVAGVIQKALKVRARIKVVCYTNGDNNEVAFIIYEKHISFKREEFIHVGEVRRKEAISAMTYLGVNKDDIIFLGYPDFGTMEILTKYWGKTKPFRSFMRRSSKVPYPECLSPGAPYVGESILKDLKKVIFDFKPTKIFVSHPADINRDHRSLYVFTRLALWDVGDKIKSAQIFPYFVHIPKWPMPRGYHPEAELNPPSNLTDVLWEKLLLTADEVKAKGACISFYKSQIEYNPPYLFTFARKNELFGDYPVIDLTSGPANGFCWQDVSVPKDEEDSQSAVHGRKGGISALAYAKTKDNLFIKLNLKHRIDKTFGISIFLLGYNKNRDFATLPKIHISIGMFGMTIRDKKQRVSVKGARISYKGNALILRIPLANLGDPDYILSSARTADLPFGQTAWRILKIK